MYLHLPFYIAQNAIKTANKSKLLAYIYYCKNERRKEKKTEQK
jgi:hypothetical protein